MCMKKTWPAPSAEELKNGKEKTLKSFYEEYFAPICFFRKQLVAFRRRM